MFKNQDKREREKQMAKKKIELSHHDTRRDAIKRQAIIALFYVNVSFCPKQAGSNRTFCQFLGFYLCSIGWVALCTLYSTHEICSHWPLGAYTLEEALT